MEQSPRIAGQWLEDGKRIAVALAAMVALAWFIEAADWLIFRGSLDSLGIVPRTTVGLRGVFLAPLLHSSFAHLLANTVPFVVLGAVVMARAGRRFTIVVLAIVVISGLGVWLLGPARTVHIGASGLIFGFFGYLVVSAYYERSLTSVAIAVMIIVVYGGILLGALPQAGPISWQGHLFGLLGGGVAAYWFASRPPAG